MLTYSIKGDLAEDKQNYLKLLLAVTLFIGGTVFTTQLAANQSISYVFWGPLFASLVVSYGLLRLKKQAFGSWIYLLGLLVACTLQLLHDGPNINISIMMIFPIVPAALLLDVQDVKTVAALSIVPMYVATAVRTDILTAFSITLVPAAVALTIAVFTYLNVTDTTTMIDWATDIQQKDTRRAETFYAQREELALKTRQVTQTLSTLELTNIKLKNAQEKTEQASRAKTTFLSNMSHELRTPLNVVIGYTSTMLEMPGMYNDIPLPELYRHDVQLIKDNGYYLLGLINDILDLSKIEAGKLEIHPAAIDLPDMFRGVVATSIGLVKDKPLQIRQDVSDNLPQVWADATRVRQIILNLMSNAIKFTQSGSVTLQARAENNQVYISVTDTGIGIPERALPHIFDRFEQAERDTEKLYGGTGLGLDISRQLARMHGGELTVQSVLGQGSTFSFNLPAYQGQGVELTLDALTAEPSVESVVSGTEDLAYTILVVEDEASLRDLMRRALESSNHVVVDLQDGEHLIDLAQGLLPDLIILDIRLPNIDGWELLKNLKSNPETAKIPVIISTVSEDEGRGLELGAAMHLRKPFSSDELLACVSEILPEPLHTNSEE